MLTPNQIYGSNIKKSLNFSQRSKNQKKIFNENIEIVKRLKSKKSFYSFKSNQEVVENSQLYYNNSHNMSNLSRFPSLNHSFNLDVTSKLSPIFYEINHPVCTKNIFIENRIFTVEITKGKKNIRIVATDLNNGDVYTIELKRNDALRLMGGIED